MTARGSRARPKGREGPVSPRLKPTPEQQLRAFVDKFEPAMRKAIRAARRTLRRRLPTANELVYDNYNFFVIGYSPNERPSDAVLSLTAAAHGLGLCFIHGAALPDPAGLLQGSGRQTRFIRLPSTTLLGRSDVSALIDEAVRRARTPFAPSRPGRLIIRSVSAKQRPRRAARTRH